MPEMLAHASVRLHFQTNCVHVRCAVAWRDHQRSNQSQSVAIWLVADVHVTPVYTMDAHSLPQVQACKLVWGQALVALYQWP